MDFACDNEVIDHVLAHPPVTAASHGVQAAIRSDQRAEQTLALLDLILPAPIAAASAGDGRRRRFLDVNELANNAANRGIAETPDNPAHGVRPQLRIRIRKDENLSRGQL